MLLNYSGKTVADTLLSGDINSIRQSLAKLMFHAHNNIGEPGLRHLVERQLEAISTNIDDIANEVGYGTL